MEKKKFYSSIAEELKLHKLIFEKTYLNEQIKEKAFKGVDFMYLLEERFNMLLGFDHFAKIAFKTKKKKENRELKKRRRQEKAQQWRDEKKLKRKKSKWEGRDDINDEKKKDRQTWEDKKGILCKPNKEKLKYKVKKDIPKKKENDNKEVYEFNEKVHEKKNLNDETCTDGNAPILYSNNSYNVKVKNGTYDCTKKYSESNNSYSTSRRSRSNSISSNEHNNISSNGHSNVSNSSRSSISSNSNISRSRISSSNIYSSINSRNALENANQSNTNNYNKETHAEKYVLSNSSSSLESSEYIQNDSDISNLSPDAGCYEKHLKHIYDLYKQNDKNVYLFANPPLCNCINKKFKNEYFESLYFKFPCLFGCFHSEKENDIDISVGKAETGLNKKEKNEMKKGFLKRDETNIKINNATENSNNNIDNDADKETDQINEFREMISHAIELKTYAKAFFDFYFLEEYFYFIMEEKKKEDVERVKSNGQLFQEETVKEWEKTKKETKEEMDEETKEEMEEETKEEMEEETEEETKEEMKEETKEEMKEESKEEMKEESKEEMKEESKEEMEEETQEEIEEEMEEETKEESKEEMEEETKKKMKVVKKKNNNEEFFNEEIKKVEQKTQNMENDMIGVLYFLNHIFQKNTVLKFFFDNCIYNKLLKRKTTICSNIMCCGLLYVPYSFIVVILNREIDSLSYICEKFSLPSNTDIYYNIKKNVITICTKNAEHEFFCYYVLQENKSVKHIFFYDVYYEGFLPFFKPLLNLGNKKGKEKLLTYLNNNKNLKLSIVIFLAKSRKGKQISSEYKDKEEENENVQQQKDRENIEKKTQNKDNKNVEEIKKWKDQTYIKEEKTQLENEQQKKEQQNILKEEEKEKEKEKEKETKENKEENEKTSKSYASDLKLHICKIYDINHNDEYKMQLKKYKIGSHGIKEISYEKDYFTNFNGRKEIINNVTINLIANKILNIANKKDIICNENCKYNNTNKKKTQNKNVKVYLCESVDSFSYDRRCLHIRKRKLITSAHAHFKHIVKDYCSNEKNEPFVEIVKRELDKHIFKKKIRKSKVRELFNGAQNLKETNDNEDIEECNSSEVNDISENSEKEISDYFFLFNENADLYTHEEYRKKKFYGTLNGRKGNFYKIKNECTAKSKCLPKKKCLEIFQSFFNTYVCSYLIKKNKLWSLEEKKIIKKKCLSKLTDEYKILIVKNLYYCLFGYYKEKFGITLTKESEEMLHTYVWKNEHSEESDINVELLKRMKRKTYKQDEQLYHKEEGIKYKFKREK